MRLTQILAAAGFAALAQAAAVPQEQASPVDAHQACSPGKFACGIKGPTDRHLWACNPLRVWEISATCSKVGCCAIGRVPGTAFCNC